MNKIRIIQLFKNSLSLSFSVLLFGCAAFQPASSIRVEVDVYKGPLSKPVPVQKAELAGIVSDTVIAADQYHSLLEEFKKQEGCPKNSLIDKCSLYEVLHDKLCDSFYKLFAYSEYKPLNNNETCDKYHHHKNPSDQLPPTTTKKKINIKDENIFAELTELAEISAQMKVQSAAIAAGLIPFVPDDERLRIVQTVLAMMASEYGNQISSRVDTLMIQLFGYGDKTDGTELSPRLSRNQLHLNKFLADSNATKAPRLYEWYDAKAPFVVEEWKYFIPGFNVNMRDRIQIYETMFNDIYWSNVNTVYASGMGNVSMALIRDEIGNWDLKNFDNDPTELLSAYKDVTIEGIKAATELISKGASGGSTELIQTAVNMANRLATPLGTTSPPTIPVTELNRRVAAQFKSLQQSSQMEWENMNCGFTDTATETKENCKNILKNTNKRIRELLHDYGIVLDTLQEINIPIESKKTANTSQK